MTQHRDLTGSELHEPKGVATASNHAVYVADGAGSGTWKQVGANEIDTTSIKNSNKTWLTLRLDLSSSATTNLLPFPFAGTVNKITAILSGALTGSDTTITLSKNGSATLGTITAAVAGSAKGTTYTMSPVTNNTFTAGDRLEFNSAGGTTAAQFLTILIEVSLT